MTNFVLIFSHRNQLGRDRLGRRTRPVDLVQEVHVGEFLLVVALMVKGRLQYLVFFVIGKPYCCNTASRMSLIVCSLRLEDFGVPAREATRVCLTLSLESLPEPSRSLFWKVLRTSSNVEKFTFLIVRV